MKVKEENYLETAISTLEKWMEECPGLDRNDFIADSIDLLRFQLKDDESAEKAAKSLGRDL